MFNVISCFRIGCTQSLALVAVSLLLLVQVCHARSQIVDAPIPVLRALDREMNVSSQNYLEDVSISSMFFELMDVSPKADDQFISTVPFVQKVMNTSETTLDTTEQDQLKIGEEINSGRWNAFGTLHLSAVLTLDGAVIKEGLVWRVFSPEFDAKGNLEVIAISDESEPSFKLIATDYIISVSYGLANATKKITVPKGRVLHSGIVLNAGGLRIISKLADGRIIPDDEVNNSIYSLNDLTVKHKLIFSSALPDKVVRLGAGNYRVVSKYGDANAVVEANVAIQAGRLSEAEIRHLASKITFKLVYDFGGEAIANTSWSISTIDGNMVVESIGAFPKHTLAVGDYTAMAHYDGNYYKKTFSVSTGLDQEIELIAAPD